LKNLKCFRRKTWSSSSQKAKSWSEFSSPAFGRQRKTPNDFAVLLIGHWALGVGRWALGVFPCCLQCRTRSPPRYLPALVLARNSRQRPHELFFPPRHRQCRLQGVSPYLSRPARVAFASHFAAAFHLALRSRL